MNGCPEHPDARKQFGCDGDADPGYLLGCWMCRGAHGPCETCGGEGWVRMTECPARIVRHDVAFMSAAWGQWKAGFLPIAGGVLDQTATFVTAMQILTGCHAMHEKQEMSSRG